MESDIQYFELRADEERQAAEDAADATTRKVHLELARQYEQLAAGKRTEAEKIRSISDAASSGKSNG